MDQKKIGLFIKECRKEVNITQQELADKLGVSFKTVSKWECGNGLPDVSLMLPLCNELKISVNELLSSKRLPNEDYKEKAEENLVDIIKKEREENKKKVIIEVLVGVPCIISLLSLFIMAGLLDIEVYQRIIILCIGFICLFCSVIGLCVLDRNIGFYECKHCKERFVPSFGYYINSLHGITWRRLKCPKCGKISNCKKRLNK